jgi:type I restriction enzyme, S subunit
MNHDTIRAEVPRGFSATTTFHWPLVRMKDVVSLHYGRALTESVRKMGVVPVFGTNGQTGWHNACLGNGPTVVLGRKGMGNLGVEWCNGPYWVIDTAYYTSFSDSIQARYFYYFTSYVGLNHLKDGTSNPSLSRDVFGRQLIPLPPTSEQQKIVAVLAALDEKIDLNRRMNETLDAMARAIFKDWFIEFGPTRAKIEGRPPYLSSDAWSLFPDRLDGEGKPQGWTAFRLDDLAVCHTKNITPSDTPQEEFEHFSLPAFDAGPTPAIDRGDTIKSNKTLMPQDAVLLSKLNPEIERVWVSEPASDGPQVCSTEFLVFTPTAVSSRALLFGLFTESSFRAMLQSMVTGTSKSHQRVSPPSLIQREVLVGRDDAFACYANITNPLLLRTLANRVESRTLARTRDLLLPKLMSGELRLCDTGGDF